MLRRILLRLSIAVAALLLIASMLAAHHPASGALVHYSAEPRVVLVPVSGVAPKNLTSSFGAPRSEHRRHQGVDIFARRNTPVVAATAGRVFRVGQNRLGGNVVWVAGDGAQLYYYAHLDHFRPGISPGQDVLPGDVLGFVGTTGNARTTPPHLHFGIYPARTGFRAIDPVPYLQTRASKKPSRPRIKHAV